ncbi:MAG: 50S ribosomal protein L11 methyltransferase [Candidatus Dadabacteria bacterium]|nr:50S ribosomal protein L11 methyltransferase [Candidatus Dadabacteria bacterium]
MKRLTIDLPQKMVAFVSDLLLGLRAGAVTEELENSTGTLIHAYFEKETDIRDIITTIKQFCILLDENPEALRFTSQYITKADWEGWKSYLKPVQASRRIVIRPPWEIQCQAVEGTKTVEINPGNAFGTGHHETTKICVGYLDQIIEKFPGCSVLDVGCGSGILAICSIKLGAEISLCVDIDFKAAREAISNSVRNAVSDKIKVCCGSADCTQKKFDVVVSNTSKDILISVKNILRQRTLPHGNLILSGIQVDEKHKVAEAYRNSGYDIVSETIDGQWAGLLFKLGESK